jgi:hypothetical protein
MLSGHRKLRKKGTFHFSGNGNGERKRGQEPFLGLAGLPLGANGRFEPQPADRPSGSGVVLRTGCHVITDTFIQSLPIVLAAARPRIVG